MSSTSRQKTSAPRSNKSKTFSYKISTRATNRNTISETENKETTKPPVSNASEAGSSSSQKKTLEIVLQQSQVNAQVNALQDNLKLPKFWKHNAEDWIALIETKFRLSRIDAQVNRYVAVLEAFDASHLERLYDVPNPEDEACYEKLITQIQTVFAGDENKRLDLLLKDLTLGVF